MESTQFEHDNGEDEISLFDLATTLGKQKKLFLGTPVVFVVIAILFTLNVTARYTAEATYVIPDKAGAFNASSMLGGAAALGGTGLVKTPEDYYAELLKTETVRMYLAQKFDLMKRYESKTKDDFLKTMNNKITISVDKKSGLISVKVEDTSPQFAADMANAHLEAVRKLMDRINATQEEMNLSFLQQQIDVLDHRPLKDPSIKTQLLMQLINNYEAIRMTEAQNQVVLNPVDYATPPQRRSFPKRTLIVLIAGFAGLFLGAMMAFMAEALNRIKTDPQSEGSWHAFKQAWSIAKHSK